MKKAEKTTTKATKSLTPEQLVEEIRERARQIFLERGSAEGDAISDWLQAEKEIKKKYKLT